MSNRYGLTALPPAACPRPWGHPRAARLHWSRGELRKTLRGITCNGAKSSKPKQFLQTAAENLEDHLLSQGGWLPGETGNNKFTEELKVLYAAAPAPKRHKSLQMVERLQWKRLPRWTDRGSCRDQQKSWCKSLMEARIFTVELGPLSLHPVEPGTWGHGWPKDTELLQTHAVKPKAERRTMRT